MPYKVNTRINKAHKLTHPYICRITFPRSYDPDSLCAYQVSCISLPGHVISYSVPPLELLTGTSCHANKTLVNIIIFTVSSFLYSMHLYATIPTATSQQQIHTELIRHKNSKILLSDIYFFCK